MVGVGAVLFHDLFNQRIKNVDFSWEDVLSFEGNTGPYVQYTYARAKSILRKGNYKGITTEEQSTGKQKIDYQVLAVGTSYELVKSLSGYEDAVKKAAERYEPSIMARYIISVAAAFNKFYHECPILHAQEKEKQARLYLVDLTQRILQEACSLLGMECPEEM